MKVVASLYLVLLALMYLPLAIPSHWRGCFLYCYWTTIALVALIAGWLIVGRWSRNA
ncbi:MAG: hypothetical protein F7C33_00850 [Desulfurococcales archaeon]|nr:hypothetical protein [Desulfurococcales archaeon]